MPSLFDRLNRALRRTDAPIEKEDDSALEGSVNPALASAVTSDGLDAATDPRLAEDGATSLVEATSGLPEGYRSGNAAGGGPETDASEYRDGNAAGGEPDTDVSEYRDGSTAGGGPETDAGEYRPGNSATPTVEEPAALADDVVAAELPESQPATAPMADTIIRDAEAATPDADTLPSGLVDVDEAVVVGSYSSASDSVPMEEVSLGFGDIETEYQESDKTGAVDGDVAVGYDVERQGEGSREADASEETPPAPVATGAIAAPADAVVVSDPVEGAPAVARMTDTVVQDDAGSSAEPGSGDAEGGAVDATDSSDGLLEAPDPIELDGGGADDDDALTLVNFEESGELPAVIETTGTALSEDILPYVPDPDTHDVLPDD